VQEFSSALTCSTASASDSRALSPREEALEHLEFAIAEFRAMKMQPSLERALRLWEQRNG